MVWQSRFYSLDKFPFFAIPERFNRESAEEEVFSLSADFVSLCFLFVFQSFPGDYKGALLTEGDVFSPSVVFVFLSFLSFSFIFWGIIKGHSPL